MKEVGDDRRMTAPERVVKRRLRAAVRLVYIRACEERMRIILVKPGLYIRPNFGDLMKQSQSLNSFCC